MAIAIDQPRFRAIVITASGNGAYLIDGLQSFETMKSDNGDAGTWSFTAPLSDPDVSALARVIAPNDIVALFVDRVQADAKTNFLGGDWDTSSLTWGSAGASVTELFANTPSCIMVGMVDEPDEEIDFQNNRGMLYAHGRDLTKIFIENDTYIPFTDPGGEKAFSGVNNVVIRYDLSGHIMLKNVLNVFVKKDPILIASLEANSALDKAFQTPTVEQNSAAQFGFPWDNFVSSVLIDDPTFLHIPQSYTLPNFSVQAGSAWPNVLELRNYPMTRLFVNEVGRLVFDYSWDAWGFNGAESAAKNPVGATITGDLVRYQRFGLSDADYVSVFTALPTLVPAGQTKIAQLWQPEQSYTGTPAAIQRYGYRWQQFQSQYDDPAAADVIENLQTKMNVLFQEHNNMARARIIVKGDPTYRVGQRLLLSYNDASTGLKVWGPKNVALQPSGTMQVWYVTNVHHVGTFPDDYYTELELRFPSEPDSALVAFA